MLSDCLSTSGIKVRSSQNTTDRHNSRLVCEDNIFNLSKSLGFVAKHSLISDAGA